LHWFVCEPPSGCVRKRLNRALAVCNLAGTVASIKICQIEREVLLADMVESSDNAALEE